MTIITNVIIRNNNVYLMKRICNIKPINLLKSFLP